MLKVLKESLNSLPSHLRVYQRSHPSYFKAGWRLDGGLTEIDGVLQRWWLLAFGNFDVEVVVDGAIAHRGR